MGLYFLDTQYKDKQTTLHLPNICVGGKENLIYGEQAVLVSVLARQWYSAILSVYHPIFPPTYSLVYLSIILFPVNIVAYVTAGVLGVPKFTANLYCICLSIDLRYT